MTKEYCRNHPNTKALSYCQSCNQYYCSECLQIGGDYYYCNLPACEGVRQSKLNEQEKTIRETYFGYYLKTALKQLIAKVKFPGVRVIFILESIFLYFVGGLLIRYRLVTEHGYGSVVAGSGSPDSLWQFHWGFGFIGLALIFTVFSLWSNKRGWFGEYDGKVDYRLGWLSSVSLGGIFVVLYYAMRKNWFAAAQALTLVILYFGLTKYVYTPGANIELSMHAYILVRADAYTMLEKWRFAHSLFLAQLIYFIIPLILVTAVRFIGILFLFLSKEPNS